MPVYEGDLAGHCIYTHALLTTAPMFPGKPTSTAEAQFLKGWQHCFARVSHALMTAEGLPT